MGGERGKGEGTFQLPEVAVHFEWDLKVSSVALAFSLQPDPILFLTFIIPFLPLRKGTGICPLLLGWLQDGACSTAKAIPSLRQGISLSETDGHGVNG